MTLPEELIPRNDPERLRLLELLRTLSYREGEFVLASGKKSNYYLDCRTTSLHPEGLTLIGSLLFRAIDEFERISGKNIAATGGLTLGADPLAAAVALTSYLRGKPIFAFIVRKEEKKHGAGGLVVGVDNIPKGSFVAILEDVITTGGSALKAAERVKESGLVPSVVLALVDRLEGGREAIEANGLPVFSLFTRNDFLKSG